MVRHDEHAAVAEDGVGRVDQAEHRFVGPVQVLQQQHDRGLVGQSPEVLGEVRRGPVAEALRVVAAPPSGATSPDLEAEPQGDDVGLVDRGSGPAPSACSTPRSHLRRTSDGSSLSWMSKRVANRSWSSA